MNLSTDHVQGIAVLRVHETRLLYPVLSQFTDAVVALIAAGERRLLIDLSSVTSVDSATVGCLMDLHRQCAGAGGVLKLSGIQKRVETMLVMTGAQGVIEVQE